MLISSADFIRSYNTHTHTHTHTIFFSVIAAAAASTLTTIPARPGNHQDPTASPFVHLPVVWIYFFTMISSFFYASEGHATIQQTEVAGVLSVYHLSILGSLDRHSHHQLYVSHVRTPHFYLPSCCFVFSRLCLYP